MTEDAEAAPITGEDSLVEVGGKDTVEAFTQVLRGAKAWAGTESRSHLPGRLP